MDSFSYLEPVCCSMSSSNCCFLTCILVSQEASQVWYSHLFQNFPQFIVIHTVKGFGIVWNSLAFLMIQWMLVIWSLGLLTFLKPTWASGSSRFPSFRIFHILLWSTQSKALAQSIKQKMIFLEFSCFFDDPVDVGNLISGSSAFSKTSLNIWKFMVLENFEHYFTSVWDECNCVVFWAFFGIAFLWDWNENWPFPVLWPLLRFPNLLAYWGQHFNRIIF